MADFDYDVILVGSGPAGVVLSYLLGRSGVKLLLIEQDSTFEREFRGPAYQPGVLADFNEMGILDEVLSVPHAVLHRLAVRDLGEILFEVDFSRLPPPRNWAIAMDQGPLLLKILSLASEFPNFTYLGNTTVDGLLKENDQIVGVKAEGREFRSRLVVGADGRYSKVRESAGIELQKAKSHFDVVWFDTPVQEAAKLEFGLKLSEEGILVVIPKAERHVRVGWILPKGSYETLRQKGIKAFNARIQTIEPALGYPLESFEECSLLDVKVAIAEKWALDGLLLIGDAAHIASPVGAQGNKLAIEDAISAHDAIMKGLQKAKGVLKRSRFHSHIAKRRREVKRIFFRQKLLENFLLRSRGPIGKRIKKWFLHFFSEWVAPQVMRAMAFGFQRSQVKTEWFAFQSEYARKHRYWALKVSKKVQESGDSCSFHLSVPSEAKGEFRYQAGQFITIRLLDQGQLHKRCFSLSSCPLEDDSLRFTVKRTKGGVVSNDLIDQVQVGDELLVYPPAGNFVLAQEAEHYFFLAGGSGIAPIMALIRYLLKRPSVKTLTLLYANHNTDSIIFLEELENLAKRFPAKLKVVHHLSDVSSRLTVEGIKHHLPIGREGTHYYLCGPQELMKKGEEAIQNPKRVHKEIFTTVPEPFEGALEEKQEAVIVGTGEVGEGKTVLVTLGGETYSIPIKPGQRILDAALEQGLNAPFSCREGICRTCAARLEEGKVCLEKRTALSDKEIEEGTILTCQAKPLTENTAVWYN